MKKLILPLLCSLLVSVPGISQTKRMAHYSHSGHDHDFRAGGADNFGLVMKREGERYVAPDTSSKADQRKYIPLRQQVRRVQLPPAAPVDPVRSRETVQPRQPDQAGPRAVVSAPAAHEARQVPLQLQTAPMQRPRKPRPQQVPPAHQPQQAAHHEHRQ